MNLRQAAEEALDALANAKDHIYLLPENAQALTEAEMLERLHTAITALRTALAEPDFKPLSAEDMAKVIVANWGVVGVWDLCRAIERAHGIKEQEP